jgi:hypothetical protein
MAHVDHDHATRKAEVCFKEIAARPNERTELLCEYAATIFNRYAQSRVELVKVERDIGPFENDLFSLRWDWLMPLTLANLDDSEEKSIETTLKGRILYWVGEAIAKVTGGGGNSVAPEPIKAPGDSDGGAKVQEGDYFGRHRREAGYNCSETSSGPRCFPQAIPGQANSKRDCR